MNENCKPIGNLPATLRVEEIATILNISRAGAYNLVKSEGFPILRIGKRLVIPKEAFIHWMDRNTGKQI